MGYSTDTYVRKKSRTKKQEEREQKITVRKNDHKIRGRKRKIEGINKL